MVRMNLDNRRLSSESSLLTGRTRNSFLRTCFQLFPLIITRFLSMIFGWRWLFLDIVALFTLLIFFGLSAQKARAKQVGCNWGLWREPEVDIGRHRIIEKFKSMEHCTERDERAWINWVDVVSQLGTGCYEQRSSVTCLLASQQSTGKKHEKGRTAEVRARVTYVPNAPELASRRLTGKRCLLLERSHVLYV